MSLELGDGGFLRGIGLDPAVGDKGGVMRAEEPDMRGGGPRR